MASSETITDFALRKIVKLAYFWLKGDSFNRASCTKIWASGTITSQSIQPPPTSHTTSFPVPSARMGTRLLIISLKAHANGRNKSQHCWAQQCWELLALVGTCCVVHANGHNTCQHCWRKVVILALITALFCPKLFLCLLALSRFFHK